MYIYIYIYISLLVDSTKKSFIFRHQFKRTFWNIRINSFARRNFAEFIHFLWKCLKSLLTLNDFCRRVKISSNIYSKTFQTNHSDNAQRNISLLIQIFWIDWTSIYWLNKSEVNYMSSYGGQLWRFFFADNGPIICLLFVYVFHILQIKFIFYGPLILYWTNIQGHCLSNSPFGFFGRPFTYTLCFLN